MISQLTVKRKSSCKVAIGFYTRALNSSAQYQIHLASFINATPRLSHSEHPHTIS